jgi:hypothetical protein
MKEVLINLSKNIEAKSFFYLHKQEMFSAISRSSRGACHHYIADHFGLQYYLSKSISKIRRKVVTRFRLSSHNIYIESSRYKIEVRSNTICTLCNLRGSSGV